MKLVELLENQRLTIQLLWGEQKIEFFSNVIEKDDSSVYVSPYIHNGSELELNVVQDKGVMCNLFTDNPITKQRISWKNVELTTVVRNEKTMYCLKTNGYNHIAKHDDRRKHDRVIVHVKGYISDGQKDEGIPIVIHDISDIGISFYVSNSYLPKEHQLIIKFTDTIGTKEFAVNVECSIARVMSKAGNQFIGCKIAKENRNYQLYCFMKHLNDKNKKKIPVSGGAAMSNSVKVADKKESTQPDNSNSES